MFVLIYAAKVVDNFCCCKIILQQLLTMVMMVDMIYVDKEQTVDIDTVD